MKTKINLQLAMLIVAVLLGATTFAQGLYVNAGAGYAFPAACYLMEEDYNSNSSGENWITNEEIVKGSGSFGKGILPGIAVGYMFNKNIGAELGIGYLLGGKIKSTDETHSSYSSSVYESTMSAKMIRFTPALKMTFGEDNIKPYMRAGLVIGAGGKIKMTNKETTTGDFDNYTEESEMELKGGVSLGFSGALGADFMLSDNIGIFGELGVITQSWAPKKGEYTKYEVDGVDHLGDMETVDREVEFVESYTYNYDNVDENSPDQALKMYFPFSSFSINVGVKISLGGGSEAK